MLPFRSAAPWTEEPTQTPSVEKPTRFAGRVLAAGNLRMSGPDERGELFALRIEAGSAVNHLEIGGTIFDRQGTPFRQSGHGSVNLPESVRVPDLIAALRGRLRWILIGLSYRFAQLPVSTSSSSVTRSRADTLCGKFSSAELPGAAAGTFLNRLPGSGSTFPISASSHRQSSQWNRSRRAAPWVCSDRETRRCLGKCVSLPLHHEVVDLLARLCLRSPATRLHPGVAVLRRQLKSTSKACACAYPLAPHGALRSQTSYRCQIRRRSGCLYRYPTYVITI